MSELFFLSRFPRFMAPQWRLWGAEPGYTAIDLETLRQRVNETFDLTKAPRCYEAFEAASRHHVLEWPAIYVHRLDARHGYAVGDLVPNNRAHEGAQFVGSVLDVRKHLESGYGLNRFRRISVGGNNRFDVPQL